MSPIKSCVVCVVLLHVVACAGDGDDVDVSSRDPRCVAACTAAEPSNEGVGEVCESASRVLCLDECETRIANVSSICQTCLVEDACFGPDGCFGGDPPFGSCNNTTCTLTTQFGTCTYNIADEAGKLMCMQQVDPRREVSCTSQFRPATDCASVCM
jgi:hypothetical protein